MIIEGIQRFENDGESGVEANVRFEGGVSFSDRVFVSVAGTGCAVADPNAFLLAAFVPAWLAGEKRILVEGSLCPMLVANLKIASATLAGWYGDFPPAPLIEAGRCYRTPVERAALFLSCGVDSLASLRHLTTTLPPGHPRRPTAAILIDYQNIPTVSRAETEVRFACRLERCGNVCDEAGVRLVAVRTNLRKLNATPGMWGNRWHGGLLAAIGHFLGSDFCVFHVAASDNSDHLEPWGSHPLLDPFYSSHHVQISHHGIELSRLEKVGLLSGWPAALDAVSVCTSPTSRGSNCGSCEKCVRTRLHMLIHGCLARSRAFAGEDVMREEIERLDINPAVMHSGWFEALPGLRQMGRHDLLEIVERRLNQTRDRQIPGKFIPDAFRHAVLAMFGHRHLNRSP